MKHTWSLFIFGAILSPLSIFFEGSVARTLLEKSDFGFTILLLCFFLNAIMYTVRCAKKKHKIMWDSFLSGGLRGGFYFLIVMTAFNYELQMVQIYGEELTRGMWYVSTIRHILMNMMIIYELEMINNNYKMVYGYSLPVIGLLVKIRNLIQDKVISKFTIENNCPVVEDKKENDLI